MISSQQVRIEVSARDRELILQHGYPFERIKESLEGLASSDEPARVRVPLFELDQLLGDLARSINDLDDEDLATELDDLYERLEVTRRSSQRFP